MRATEDPTQIVRNAIASGADVIAAGGGDGTISTVANQLVGTGVALGVLPFGTLNHFAKDLGIPLDPRGAVEVVCRGAIKQVDVGEVNGFYFINNSSLGVYPEMARASANDGGRCWASGRRSRDRRSHNAAPIPISQAQSDIDGQRRRRRVPLLFVGNNVYSVERLDWVGANAWMKAA